MTAIRWNLAVPPELDQAVRMHLAANGGGRKGDLSRFIERAVRAHLLESAAADAKTAANELTEPELSTLIDEAVTWARDR